jgi:AcrR family transcriptional regulator
MAKRVVQGEIRNKEKTKQKLLNAVGKLLKTKGHAAVKVNAVASASGVNKRLIYEYFGGLDGLIDEYIKQQDYWKTLKDTHIIDEADNGKQFIIDMLNGQFDALRGNKALQKMIVWELSEGRKSLKANAMEREEYGNQIFSEVMDVYFGKNAERFRAIMALLISGIYYLNIHTGVNGSTFCGLDLKSDNGRDEIKNAIDFVIGQAYSAK